MKEGGLSQSPTLALVMRVMRCIGIIYKKKPKVTTVITYPSAGDEVHRDNILV